MEKVKKKLLSLKRIGNYSISITEEDNVLVVFKRFSSPRDVYIICAREENLTKSFASAMIETKDFTPCEILRASFALNLVLCTEKKASLIDLKEITKELNRRNFFH